MDRTSYDELNKGKQNFLLVLLAVAVIIGIAVGLFTTNKSEKLICSRTKNICYVEKTNYLNLKKSEEIIKMSDILYPTYIPKTVAGNMYARGYSAYYLAFMGKDKKTVQIFSIEYYEKEELDEVKNNLKNLLKSSKDEFSLEQKL